MAKNDITVDEFVKTKVLPEFQPIVEILRKLLHKYAPDAKEMISYGIPNYKRFRDLKDINEDALRCCIKQALEFDNK